MRYVHTCIRVKDLDASIDFYKKALDYEVKETRDYPEDEFTLVYLELPDSNGEQLELTYNYDHEAYDLGNGYGHMAYYTDDLEKEHQRMKDDGIEVGDLGGLSGDEKPRFFFISDPDGYDIEIIKAGY